MKKWKIKKINKKTWALIILVAIILLVPANVVFAVDNAVSWPVRLLGSLVNALVSLFGRILIIAVELLVRVASHDVFINAPVVDYGWKVVRDLANMFFIVVLLVIAFATILGIEKYNYKKWLPKLVLMAILINFSKTICGLLIDVSQVVMLTFVNAFKDVGYGNVVEMLGIEKWRTLKDSEAIDWQVAAAFLLALFYVLISLATVVAMLGMLVMRIIMIWIYVVLSPLAYLLAAFPGGAKYASRWWAEFTRNLIIGPVLAFFIWLSFAALGVPSDPAPGDAVGSFNSADLMMKFMISVAMLMGGMKIAQEIGGESGNVAGKTFSKVKRAGLVGFGAVGGSLGYNFAKRRVGQWRQDTKKMVQQKSDLAYEKIKSKVVGVASGTFSGINKFATPKKSEDQKKKERRIELRRQAEKQEKKRHEEELYNAYHEGKYTDSAGEVYNWDEEKERYINENGTVATYQDRKGKTKEVKRMNSFTAGFKEKYRDKTTKANALRNQINEEKMTKKQQIYTQAGTSVVDLKRVLNDDSATSSKRMAAALQLAIKNGFKNSNLQLARQDVSKAKTILGNNEPMLDKFNENINKNFAALNFDLDTERGVSEYKVAMSSGRVDGYKQDYSTVDKNMLKTLRDYSGKDFTKNISGMMSISQAHREKIMEANEEAKNDDLSNGEKLYDTSTHELNPHSKILAKNGDMQAAFNNSSDSSTLNFDNQSVNALKAFLKTATASDLSNFNNDVLDTDKLSKMLKEKNISASNAEIKNMKTRIENSIVDEVDVTKLASLEYLDKNPEFVRRSKGLIERSTNTDKQQQIKDNNLLKNIKSIF